MSIAAILFIPAAIRLYGKTIFGKRGCLPHSGLYKVLYTAPIINLADTRSIKLLIILDFALNGLISGF